MKKPFCTTLFLLALALGSLAGCGYHDEEHEKNVLNGMLINEQYDALDQRLAKANAQYDGGKLASDRWAGRFHSLANINADNVITRFDAWVAHADSGYAHLARGMYLQAQAWEARGDKLAAQTSPAQFQALYALATRAKADLEAADGKLSACALCAGELITVNRALGRPASESLPLLEAAVLYDPHMASPVLSYFPNLFPQWGGSYEQMEAFIATMRASVDPAIVDLLESRYCWERARQAERAGDREAGLAWYQKGVTAHPYDMLMKNLAETYAERGDHEQAAAILERNLAVNDAWDLYSTEALAQQYYALGRQDDGDRMMKRRDELQRRYNAYE